MIRKSMPSGHDPMGGYRFSLGTNAKFARRSCSNKNIERDDDSKKSQPALGNHRPQLAESRRNAALGKDDLPVLVAARRERPGAAQEIENPHPIEPLAVFGDDPIPVRCEVRVPGAQRWRIVGAKKMYF